MIPESLKRIGDEWAKAQKEETRKWFEDQRMKDEKEWKDEVRQCWIGAFLILAPILFGFIYSIIYLTGSIQ